MVHNQLKELPSVSEVLLKCNKYKSHNSKYITYIIKSELDSFRRYAKKGTLKLNRAQIIQKIFLKIKRLTSPNMQSVINGTGIVLHTGLGRAPMKATLVKQVVKRISGYTNLEFDLPTGKRGQRQDHVNELLSALTGAQSAIGAKGKK